MASFWSIMCIKNECFSVYRGVLKGGGGGGGGG